jgi:hypothetical protein
MKPEPAPGAPVLDASGHVVGIATGTLNGMILAILTGVLPQNVNFAVKANVLRNFLETHEIAYTHVAGAHELHASDVARQFTVYVDCRKRNEMHAMPAVKH